MGIDCFLLIRMLRASRIEQETIVNYNVGEQTATVYTRDKAVMRRLDALKDAYPDTYKLISETDIDKTYEMPKSLINYRKENPTNKDEICYSCTR